MDPIQPHIQLSKSLITSKYAILPGDPKRIDTIKQFLTNPKEIQYNREFRSVEGLYKNMPILAISTGIGGSSTSIVVEELKNLGVTTLIRVGSAGAFQNYIKIGDLIIAEGVIRDDGASKAYVDPIYPACPNHSLLEKIIQSCNQLNYKYHTGVILSHETFYHDQNDEESEKWSKLGVLGADFESAALMTVGRIRGCKCASILNNVVEYGKDTAESVGNYIEGENLSVLGEKREIEIALEACYKMEMEKSI